VKKTSKIIGVILLLCLLVPFVHVRAAASTSTEQYTTPTNNFAKDLNLSAKVVNPMSAADATVGLNAQLTNIATDSAVDQTVWYADNDSATWTALPTKATTAADPFDVATDVNTTVSVPTVRKYQLQLPDVANSPVDSYSQVQSALLMPVSLTLADVQERAGQDATFALPDLPAGTDAHYTNVSWEQKTTTGSWTTIAGQTNSSLVLSKVATSQNQLQVRAHYQVSGSDTASKTTSAATLTVQPAIATRALTAQASGVKLSISRPYTIASDKNIVAKLSPAQSNVTWSLLDKNLQPTAMGTIGTTGAVTMTPGSSGIFEVQASFTDSSGQKQTLTAELRIFHVVNQTALTGQKAHVMVDPTPPPSVALASYGWATQPAGGQWVRLSNFKGPIVEYPEDSGVVSVATDNNRQFHVSVTIVLDDGTSYSVDTSDPSTLTVVDQWIIFSSAPQFLFSSASVSSGQLQLSNPTIKQIATGVKGVFNASGQPDLTTDSNKTKFLVNNTTTGANTKLTIQDTRTVKTPWTISAFLVPFATNDTPVVNQLPLGSGGAVNFYPVYSQNGQNAFATAFKDDYQPVQILPTQSGNASFDFSPSVITVQPTNNVRAKQYISTINWELQLVPTP